MSGGYGMLPNKTKIRFVSEGYISSGDLEGENIEEKERCQCLNYEHMCLHFVNTQFKLRLSHIPSF